MLCEVHAQGVLGSGWGGSCGPYAELSYVNARHERTRHPMSDAWRHGSRTWMCPFRARQAAASHHALAAEDLGSGYETGPVIRVDVVVELGEVDRCRRTGHHVEKKAAA